MTSPFRFKADAQLAGVPLLDIGRENHPLEQETIAAFAQVMRSGRFVLGPEVSQLEQRVAKLCDVPHAVGCASGSDALLLALMAIDVRPGDEVIVPSFTFFATASAVVRLGASPVFVDIDPATFNLRPAAVKAAVTSRTKAIIPVHLFGRPAAMEPLLQLGMNHGLAIIEDAAQAIGAELNGKPVGSMGDLGCFSFYPTKNLGGFGDAGMLTTTSDELADRLRLLRTHGMHPRYFHSVVGINSRLDTLQAVALNVKLPHLHAWSAARAKNAARYQRLFQEADLTDVIALPGQPADAQHVWNQYTIRAPGFRDELREYLAQHNVGSEIYYPVPLHLQECFASIEQRFSLTETERAAKEVLSLPIFPALTELEQQTVVTRISEFIRAGRAKSLRRKVA